MSYPLAPYRSQHPIPEQKTSLVAYLLLIFLAHFGVHCFYLNRTSRGIWELVLFVVGAFLTTTFIGAIIGIPMLIAYAVMWIYDAIHIPRWVYQANYRTYYR